jgi:hypothetical protein
MSKRFSLTFTENGTRAVAELLEPQAPKTCAAIWDALHVPAEGKAIHAMYAGRELIFGLPEVNQTPAATNLPAENQIIVPIPGDVCFGYFAPNELNSPGAGNPHEVGFFDLMFFYGRNARLFSSQGWLPTNLFARIAENLDGFAEMCARVHREGVKTLRVERFEHS